MMVVGDPSGDLNTSHVVAALKRLRHDCEVFGIGGEHMVSAGFEDAASHGKNGCDGLF